MAELLYKEITFDIRGACFAVWKAFAGAFKEKAVERALVIELKRRNRKVGTQKRIGIFYGNERVGYYIPDIVVDDSVLVEVKSKEFLTEQDYNQFWKYLKGSKYQVGLLINFGSKNLEIKRVIYDSARQNVSASVPRSYQRQSAEKGFTLMEIVVATAIFAFVSVALMSLFNYTLKINRRSEALRQATQGMRNFAEFLVKEVRNGRIDYYVQNGSIIPRISATSPCILTAGIGGNTYAAQDNKLGVVTSDGYRECFYFADSSKTYVPLGSPNAFAAPAGSSYILVMEKSGGIKENLIPANYRIENLKFIIRPLCDPYSKCSSYGNDYPRIQPSVSIFIKFVAQLPTGEQVPIYYQTSISVNDYNIPSS